MPWLKGGAIWVGRHKSRGLVVIPKSSMHPKSRSFDVYFFDQNRIAQCKAEIMRENTTGKGIESEDAQRALDAFLVLRNKELEEKNRKFLELRKKVFAGTRARDEALPSRITHCYSCKSDLDSTIDLECIACEWILCQCGACGCGYNYA